MTPPRAQIDVYGRWGGGGEWEGRRGEGDGEGRSYKAGYGAQRKPTSFIRDKEKKKKHPQEVLVGCPGSWEEQQDDEVQMPCLQCSSDCDRAARPGKSKVQTKETAPLPFTDVHGGP